MATMLSCAKAGPVGPAAKLAGPAGPAVHIAGPQGPAAGTMGPDGSPAEDAEPDGPAAGHLEPDGAPLRVEQVRPTVFQLTLQAFDLAALIAGARWAAAGGGPRGELPPKTLEQLRRVLARFDDQWRRI